MRLRDEDLPRIGALIGVGEDEIHALLDVESAGRGFDTKGRVKILYEPHVFYRNSSGRVRDQAVRIGVAYPRWRQKPYPKDSYPRLKAAMKLSPEIGMLACSWGLGQILGENFKLAGFETIHDMVDAFKTGEAAQLEGMVNFIKNTGLDKHLRNHDWEKFARGYNGPNYHVHGYHTRLKQAFDKWSKIPDTPWVQRELADA